MGAVEFMGMARIGDIALITGHNCRDRVMLKDLQEMIASIKEKGVIQPVLCRPTPRNGDHAATDKPYQLVAGERRWRSALKIYGEDGEIPVMVREMSDNEAHELMLIENLQRRRLTPLEEARSFKDYVDRHGDAGVEQLSDRVQITQTRIRRRIAILRLPQRILKAWDDGEIVFGALEALLRVSHDTADDIYEWYLQELEYGRTPSVNRIEGKIGQVMLRLSGARFNTGEVCAGCPKNSKVQLDLFNLDGPEKTVCFDRVCFTAHQREHFDRHWGKTGLAREHGTARAVFEDDVPHSDRKGIYQATQEKCLSCSDYVSIIYLNGEEYMDRCCIGPHDCFQETYSKGVHAGVSEVETEVQDEAAREAKYRERLVNHGRDARAIFYLDRLETAVPDFLSGMYTLPEAVDPDDEEAVADFMAERHEMHREYILRLSIFAFFKGHQAEMAAWFAAQTGHDPNAEGRWYQLKDVTVLKILTDMAYTDLMILLDKMGQWVLLQDEKVSDPTREAIGDWWYGINIEKEWIMNEAFLKRKQKLELIDLAERLRLFENEKFTDYLHVRHQTDVLHGLKKSEMIDAILKSGIELKGLTPREVVSDPKA